MFSKVATLESKRPDDEVEVERRVLAQEEIQRFGVNFVYIKRVLLRSSFCWNFPADMTAYRDRRLMTTQQFSITDDE